MVQHSKSRATKNRKAARSAGQDWKTAALMAGVTLVLLAAAAGFRSLLMSQHHTTVGGPYALIDGHGHAVSQADFKGRYTLIYFGYTHCVDVCPLTLETVSVALNELGDRGRAVTPLFISVDPERDTPKVVQDYVERFSPQIVGLTGTQTQIHPIMEAFHVSARHQMGNEPAYLVDHSSLLYLMDGQNHLVGMIPVDSSAHQIAADLVRMLPAS